MKLILFLFAFRLLGESLVIDSGSPADQYFEGGNTFMISYPNSTGDLNVRYGAFRYRIPQDPGVYLVTLNFRETGTVSAKGQRIFSVKLGGQTVLDRFDLFATTGLATIERNFVAVSNNGFIDIDFSYTVKSAIVSSITVQQLFQSALNGQHDIAFSESVAFKFPSAILPCTWEIYSGSIGGLTLNSETGLFSGTPTAIASLPITIRAIDLFGYTAPKTVLVNIK